jgi:hypothetical protein
MTTNIQNPPKSTKNKLNKCKLPCCSSQLDTNTESVRGEAENIPSISSPKSCRLRNRIDLLNDKNTGKKLITNKEKETKKNTRHTYCGLSAKKDFVSIETSYQHNHKNKLERRNFITGTALCKEIWRCPTCSMKLLKGRASEILELTKAHQKQGYKLGFVTLTVQHTTKNTLKQTLDKLLNNYRKFQRNQYFRSLKNSTLLGQVKSLEITITKQNGYHPHLHIIYFYKTKDHTIIEPIQKKLISNWALYTNGSVNAQDQQIVYTDKDITDYITKWDAIQELTNDFNKTSKGIKPFQLLTIITKKHHYFANETLEDSLKITRSIWLEYVEFTKGKRRITTSRKLNQEYKVEEKTDEQILSEKQESEKITSFSQSSWNIIYKNNLQPYLLHICDQNTNLQIQLHEILKFLSEYDDFYLDHREWDKLKLSDEPIIRLKTDEQAIKNITSFSYN